MFCTNPFWVAPLHILLLNKLRLALVRIIALCADSITTCSLMHIAGKCPELKYRWISATPNTACGKTVRCLARLKSAVQNGAAIAVAVICFCLQKDKNQKRSAFSISFFTDFQGTSISLDVQQKFLLCLAMRMMLNNRKCSNRQKSRSYFITVIEELH